MDQIPDLLHHLLIAHIIPSLRCIGISTLDDLSEAINSVQTLIKVYLCLLLLLLQTSLFATGGLGELPLNLFFPTLEMRPEHL